MTFSIARRAPKIRPRRVAKCCDLMEDLRPRAGARVRMNLHVSEKFVNIYERVVKGIHSKCPEQRSECPLNGNSGALFPLIN